MPSIHTSIEIAASPSTVRAIFLDFDSLHTWHKGFINSIEQHNLGCNSDRKPKSGFELQPGQKLHNILGDGKMEFYPTILANDENEFKWLGKLWGMPGLFTGAHAFRFENSEEIEGGTRFVQAEEFWGLLTPICGEGTKMYAQTKGGFEGFNRDLKARCEKSETK